LQYPPAGQVTPPVWKWYIAYCVAMAVGFLFLAIMGVVFFFVDPAELDMSPGEARLMSITFVVLGLALMAPYAAAPFLPRRRWGWVVGIVLICLGMTSTCCLPFSIALLIFWIRPENKAFFGYVEG
jgi:drug/metabolite transporter (DMT)-like permease